MVRLSFVKKLFAISIGSIFFVVNVALANAPEANFWAERRKAANSARRLSNRPLQLASLPLSNQLPPITSQPLTPSISQSVESQISKKLAGELGPLLNALSPQYGTIRKVSVPQNTRTHADTPTHALPHQGGGIRSEATKIVIHIQDVHLNSEAQENIGKILGELVRQNQLDLVALEGLFEPLDLQRFRTFPYPKVIKSIGNYLLKTNGISGPVHTLLTSSKKIPPAVGVDDEYLYHANVAAYKQSVPFQEKYKGILAQKQDKLEKQKAVLLNQELKAFDAQVQAFRGGKISLGAYVSLLEKGGQARKASAKDIDIFLQALAIESRLDFHQVETERADLIADLVKKLDDKQMARLVNLSVAYRVGEIRHSRFYEALKTLCQENGIVLNQHPAMVSYLEYVRLSDQIDAVKLFDQLSQLETERYQSLIQTPQEAEIIRRSKQLHFTEKLLDFSLTPKEWKQYQNIRSKDFGLRTKLNQKSKDSSTFNLSLKTFESFYEAAEARDEAMVQNLLSAMKEHDAKVAVLVTGGFHDHGMGPLLEEAGITRITFVPKISEVKTEKGTNYLSVFTQEKTPLEKLFEGEKLFVTPNPARGLGYIPVYGVAFAHLIGQTPQWVYNNLSDLTAIVERVLLPSGAVEVTVQPEGGAGALVARVQVKNEDPDWPIEIIAQETKMDAAVEPPTPVLEDFLGRAIQRARAFWEVYRPRYLVEYVNVVANLALLILLLLKFTGVLEIDNRGFLGFFFTAGLQAFPPGRRFSINETQMANVFWADATNQSWENEPKADGMWDRIKRRRYREDSPPTREDIINELADLGLGEIEYVVLHQYFRLSQDNRRQTVDWEDLRQAVGDVMTDGEFAMAVDNLSGFPNAFNVSAPPAVAPESPGELDEPIPEPPGPMEIGPNQEKVHR